MSARRHSLDPGAIFDDPQRTFLPLGRVVAVRPRRDGADLRVQVGGQEIAARIACVSDEIVRLRIPVVARPSALLAEPVAQARVRTRVDRRTVSVHTAALTVELERAPWRLRVLDRRGRPVFSELADRDFDGYITSPTGLAVHQPSGARHAYLTFALGAAEEFVGLGERYGPIGRRGLRTVLWCTDTHGTNSTDLVYTPVPFVMSTAGYGMFIHTTARTVVDLGAYSVVSGWAYVEEPCLDVFLIYGPTLAEILRRYLDLTGRPALPPRWSFGVWMSRCMYRSRREVEQVVRQARRRGFPLDVVHLDPLWLAGRSARDYDSCDLRWDERAFPRPGEFIRWLRRQGVRLSLWENPYFPMDSPRYAPAARRGYFLRTTRGEVARFRGREAAIVDFTHPGARRWYAGLHRPLLRAGVAVFKTDYGEEVPEDAIAHDGTPGALLHNVYPLLYTRTVFEATAEVSAQPLVWARSGWAGSQRYPVHWSGDAPSRWDVLPAVMGSGLSLALSGFAFWSHDIGGFYGLRDPDLLVRWAQLGLLSSHARFHGTEPREPWRYGPRAFRIIRRYARLRMRLLPYLYTEAAAAVAAGAPLMRPLILDFQDDPTTWRISDQYLLGRSLLIAPVLTPDGRRWVYLPSGQWWDFWRHTRHSGPRWVHLEVPLEEVPVFVRDGTIVPLGPEVEHSGQADHPLTFQVRLTDAASGEVLTTRGRVAVAARAVGDRLEAAVRGGRGDHVLVWVGARAAGARLTGRGRLVGVRQRPEGTEVAVRAAGPYRVILTARRGIEAAPSGSGGAGRERA
ncbi:MAG: glycoside hydrolase family 31 protein [Armatimonadota bacterium]|nr:glycoside hydrolase family 31 protein [Armatimonadota bacterium]MDR7509080.1 glycoside hydrolase family 31 protein [Armatimonadota bacterium]